MKCKACGYENAEDAKFCVECGAPLEKEKSDVTPSVETASAEKTETKKEEKKEEPVQTPKVQPASSSVLHLLEKEVTLNGKKYTQHDVLTLIVSLILSLSTVLPILSGQVMGNIQLNAFNCSFLFSFLIVVFSFGSVYILLNQHAYTRYIGIAGLGAFLCTLFVNHKASELISSSYGYFQNGAGYWLLWLCSIVLLALGVLYCAKWVKKEK